MTWDAGTKAHGSSSDCGRRRYGGWPSLAVEVCQLALRHRRGVSRGGLSCGRVRLALATVLCTGLLSGAVAAHSVSWGGSGGTLWSVRWEHRVLTAVGDTKKKNKKNHGQPWSTMADHRRPWSTMGRPRSTMVDHGRPWSTKVDNRPWSTMVNQRIPYLLSMFLRSTFHSF